MSDPVLCYVSGSAAYFTTQPLLDQWGDDWDDAPYEHNAGTPYSWRPEKWDRDLSRQVPNDKPRYEIVTVYWGCDLVEPDWDAANSRYSVEQINRLVVPWLRVPSWRKEGYPIWAGTTLDEFKRLIWLQGGRIWVEELAPVAA